MAKFILVLMLLTPSGTLRQHRILSRPMPQSLCVEAAEHPAVNATYRVDYWTEGEPAGHPTLLCVEMETNRGNTKNPRQE